MADFETKLRWLSERGTPSGADELIERIEAELAGNPLVVVADRQEDTPVAGTKSRPVGDRPSRSRKFVWAVALVATTLTVAGIDLVLVGNRNLAAGDPAVSTLAPPDGAVLTDLQVIEAGVAALYSGDADRAVELFELPQDDDWIRTEAAYQVAIGGRLGLDCTPLDDPGVFSCVVPYQNAVADAIGWVDSPGDTVRVSVVGGVITEFGFPVHSFLERGLEKFLAESGAGNPDCGFEHTIECALVVMGHLDAFAAWAETNLVRPVSLTDLEIAEAGVGALYSGDANGAAGLVELSSPACCNGRSPDDWIQATAAFHYALSGRASAECVEEGTPGWFRCTVSHRNLFTDVIGWADPPAETIRVAVEAGVITELDQPVFLIHDALNRFLQEQGTLQEQGLLDLGDSSCSFSTPLSPIGWLTEDCLDYVRAHLEDWVAWAEANLEVPPPAVSPVIEAGVEALYSGDGERAAELFELADRDDDEIRRLAAYESAINGRITLICWERGSGRFNCFANYQNALTDSIGSGPPGDHFSAAVEDGVITEFYFPEHTYLRLAVADYLSKVEGDTICASEFFTEYFDDADAPPTTDCVTVIMEKLDEWAAWSRANGLD